MTTTKQFIDYFNSIAYKREFDPYFLRLSIHKAIQNYWFGQYKIKLDQKVKKIENDKWERI